MVCFIIDMGNKEILTNEKENIISQLVFMVFKDQHIKFELEHCPNYTAVTVDDNDISLLKKNELSERFKKMSGIMNQYADNFELEISI